MVDLWDHSFGCIYHRHKYCSDFPYDDSIIHEKKIRESCKDKSIKFKKQLQNQVQ